MNKLLPKESLDYDFRETLNPIKCSLETFKWYLEQEKSLLRQNNYFYFNAENLFNLTFPSFEYEQVYANLSKSKKDYLRELNNKCEMFLSNLVIQSKTSPQVKKYLMMLERYFPKTDDDYRKLEKMDEKPRVVVKIGDNYGKSKKIEDFLKD